MSNRSPGTFSGSAMTSPLHEWITASWWSTGTPYPKRQKSVRTESGSIRVPMRPTISLPLSWKAVRSAFSQPRRRGVGAVRLRTLTRCRSARPSAPRRARDLNRVRKADNADIAASIMGPDRYMICLGYAITASDRIFGTHAGSPPARLKEETSRAALLFLRGGLLDRTARARAREPEKVRSVAISALDGPGPAAREIRPGRSWRVVLSPQ